MVEVAVAEPDRDKRNRLAGALIQLMGMLNPHLRDVADYKHKLWDHLFVISDFKLDVDSPYPIPTRESIAIKPDMMKYPQRRIRYRFYGKNIEQMISRAGEMPEGPSKTGFILDKPMAVLGYNTKTFQEGIAFVAEQIGK
jgi:hypothetical protein